jgi:hypothetical protein
VTGSAGAPPVYRAKLGLERRHRRTVRGPV